MCRPRHKVLVAQLELLCGETSSFISRDMWPDKTTRITRYDGGCMQQYHIGDVDYRYLRLVGETRPE